MSQIVNKETLVHYKKISQELRDGFDRISDKKRKVYYIEFFPATENYSDKIGEFEYDILFVGKDDFLIRATEDGRFYSRPCFNNPEVGIRDLNEPYQNKYPKCTYGAYFNMLDEAIDTSIAWLLLDAKDLPRCYTPPFGPSEGE